MWMPLCVYMPGFFLHDQDHTELPKKTRVPGSAGAFISGEYVGVLLETKGDFGDMGTSLDGNKAPALA